MITLLRTLTLLPMLALASCSSPLGWLDSDIALPASWRAAPPNSAEMPLANDAAAPIEQRWWHSFGDATLDRLVERTLAGNKTLGIAEARVAEARAGRRAARAELLPTVSATAGASRGNPGLVTGDRTTSLRAVDLQASWELDLFGKNQARAAAASAILQSEDARRQAAMVSLLGEVARGYFDLRNLQAQIAITGKSLATQQRTLALIQAQQAGALTSDLDVARAAAQVATISAQIPLLRAEQAALLNRLNLLLGEPPGSADAWLLPEVALRPLDGRILIAAPAAVLANRPDVRAAERGFAAGISASDAAAREVFPTVSLVALFGFQDSGALSATPWTLAAGLVQPLLNFGRIEAGIAAADARQRQAFLAYQQTVLEALGDMESALSRYLEETRRQRDLQRAAEQDRRSVELAELQYRSGYAGLLDLLVAQRDELAARSSLAASDAQLRKSLVTIYAAAGGGWDL